jgi:hypothetical protein
MRPEKQQEWPHGKYLIIDPDGTPHLPIRDDEQGAENHNLMGCAHAALYSPQGYRGKPYEGQRKNEARAKLKTAYQQEGMDWPDTEANEGACSDCSLTPCLNTSSWRAV